MREKITFLCVVSLFTTINSQTTGKVGINTENPTETLQVKGTFRVSELPDSNTPNSIYTRKDGGNSDIKTQTFVPTKMVVVDNNGVFGKQNIPNILNYTGSTSILLENNSFKRAALTGDVIAAVNNNTVTVTKLQGKAISTLAPTQGQVLKWNGSQWTPTNDISNTNIYNANGMLDANRTVNMGGRTLDFIGGKTSFVNNQETISIKSAGTGQSTYIGFYKNGDNTRSAYLGFSSNRNNNFSIKNELAGGIVNIENNAEIVGTLKVSNLPNGITTDDILVADTNGNVRKRNVNTIKDELNRVSIESINMGATKDLSNLSANDFKDLYVIDNGTIRLPACSNNYQGKMVSFYKWGGEAGEIVITTGGSRGGIHNASTTVGFTFPQGISYRNNSLIITNRGNLSSVGFRLIRLICIGDSWFVDYGFR